MKVREVQTASDRAAAYAVRRTVFQDEQRVAPELEFDADDEVAVHVVAETEGRIVGTGRVVFHPDHAKIGRMAVLPAWRKRGVGHLLLAALMRAAAQGGAARAVLHAQVHAIGFYERAGFAVVGDQFDEAGIPHRRMQREIT